MTMDTIVGIILLGPLIMLIWALCLSVVYMLYKEMRRRL